MTLACTTIFFHAAADELAALYETATEQQDGYLTQVGETWVFTDALATATADWVRQLELATAMSQDDVAALTVLIVGDAWTMSVAFDGQRGPVAVFAPGEERQPERLPHELLALERTLTDLFPDDIEAEGLDALFGAVLDGALPMEQVVDAIMTMLHVPEEWTRWSWYDLIPEQLFVDPDLADRVKPLGEAKAFWEV